MEGVADTEIPNRPVRMTASSPLALEAASEIAAFRLDGPQNAPSPAKRELIKSAHGRVADRDGAKRRPPRRP